MLVATTAGNPPAQGSIDAALERWATTVRRLLQRGRNPIIAPDLDAALPHNEAVSSLEAISAALIGPTGPIELDPSIELHPTWERPFWESTRAEHAGLSRWLTPQVSLEALIGRRHVDDESHWVDFLLHVPWRAKPVVLEIDGSGHERSAAVDGERDRQLRQAGLNPYRIPGSSIVEPDAEFRRGLRGVENEQPDAVLDAARREVLAPALIHRLAFAMTLQVEQGNLIAGAESWCLRVDDELDCVGPGIPWVLRFLRRVDAVVGGGTVPDDVIINGERWTVGADDYHSSGQVSGSPTAAVVLESFTPPHHRLPEFDIPTVVIRPAFLPRQPAWWPEPVRRRWNLPMESSADTERALEGLAHDLYGYPSLRPGQLDAMRQVLRGEDSVVLLPTGSGKSLIYQLTALLRPGLCLIVDPIQALIDDQERRFREAGIDRIVAIHSGRRTGRRARDEMLRAVGSGDALFVLVTPERLLNADFRDALQNAAYESTVGLAVVDEAHCVSEWGHDFRPAFLRLGANLRRFGRNRWDEAPPVLALTGTASPRVLNDTLNALEIDRTRPGALQRPKSFDRPNLRYAIRSGTPSERRKLLRETMLASVPEMLSIDHISPEVSGICFLANVNGSRGFAVLGDELLDDEVLGQVLREEQIGYFAGTVPARGSGESRSMMFDPGTWPAKKREFASRFIRDELPLLIATKAFGMGIDKPNIRFTVHVGYPSSIEAFAQEAGRAGRDGSTSACVMIGHLPPEQLVELRLQNPDERPPKDGGANRRRNDDWAAQEYFLFKSYPGVKEETDQTLALYRELRALGAKNYEILEVPPVLHLPDGSRLATENKENAEAERDGVLDVKRLLHRLSDVGVVDDIDYTSGGKLRIHFRDFEDDQRDAEPRIDASLLAFLARNDPGRLRAHQRRVAEAPRGTDARVAHHIEVAVEAVYTVIYRARLNALEAVHRLARDAPEDQTIRARITAYLGQGPMADALDELTRDEKEIDVVEAIRRFDASPPSDDYEWRGAADRMLESYPNHPLVLLVSALGEFRLPTGDLKRFDASFRQMLASLATADIGDSDRWRIVAWALQQIRAAATTERRSWLREAWYGIGASALGMAGTFDRIESTVLERARNGDFVTAEIEGLQGVLLNRTRRALKSDLRHLSESRPLEGEAA